MAEESDLSESAASVEVRITFYDEPPTSLFLDTLNVIEQETYQVQRGELEAALDSVEGISGHEKAQCRRVIEDTRGASLRFTRASSGSLVLFAGMTALAYWVIENTVGETFKQAYVQTKLHKQLKRFLVGRTRKQASDLSDALSGRLVRHTSDTPVIVDVRLDGDQQGRQVVHVSVRINPLSGREVPPPTLLDWSLRNGGV